MIRLDDLSADFGTDATNTGQSVAGRVRCALARAYRAVIAGQEARAERLVYGYMARQSDQSLARLGFDAAEIEGIRRQGRTAPLGSL
jgi:hypothetical protein